MNEMNELQDLREIKTIIEIPDYSLMITIFLSFILLIIIFFIFKNIFIFYKNKTKKDKKLFYINKLKKIDFNNPKKSAYTITKYTRELATDERSQKLYEKLNKEVEIYKYKQDSPQMNEEIKKHLHLFIEVVDGKI